MESVQAYVLGGHGDDMVPLTSHTTAGGVPVSKLLPADRLEAIERTRKGGAGDRRPAQDRQRLPGPVGGRGLMVDSILLDKKQILPARPT